MPPASCRNRDDGFTLLEMLVSLVLLALILTIVAQMIFGARLALNFIDRRAAQGPVTAAQAYIRAVVSQSRDVPELLRAGETIFSGAPTEMTFISGHAPRGSYQGLYRVTLHLRPNGGTNDLMVDLQLARPAGAKLQPAKTSVPVLRNIRSASFAYTDGDGKASSSWDGAVLPNQIGIKISFPPGDRRRWTDLIIAPELSAASKVACPSRTTCE